MAFTTLIGMMNYKEYSGQTYQSVQRSGSLYDEYVVVTDKHKSDIEYEQLWGKRFSSATDSLPMSFPLNYLDLKEGAPSVACFIKESKDTCTALQAVLDVNFDKSDAFIVPQHILGIAVELNPASVGYAFLDSIRRIHESPRSEQVIKLFKIHSAVLKGPEKPAVANYHIQSTRRLAGLEQ